MRNIQEIDRELERARQKMERSRKLDVILQDLKEQSVRRRQAEEEARAVLEKEQGDVEELERMSLVSFLARIQGDLESRKAEERREAAMAKARYDAAKWDLEDLDRRLRDFAQEKESMQGLEKQYQALLDEKEAVLRSQGALSLSGWASWPRSRSTPPGSCGRSRRPSRPVWPPSGPWRR